MNKICTDIEQSKKLTKILPIESADMWWAEICEGKTDGWNFIVSDTPYYSLSLVKPSENNYSINTVKDIPCWSLAALLNYLREIDFFPEIDADEHSVTMNIDYYDEDEGKLLNPVHNIEVKAENFIDAAFEIIIKYKEENLL